MLYGHAPGSGQCGSVKRMMGELAVLGELGDGFDSAVLEDWDVEGIRNLAENVAL